VKTALRAYTILLLVVNLAYAQDQVRPMGLIWEIPESMDLVRSDLEMMDQAGYNHLVAIGQPNDELVQLLRNYEMRVLFQLPEFYLTRNSIDHRKAQLRTLYDQSWAIVRDYPFLSGLSLFMEGEVYRKEFLEMVSTLKPGEAKESLLFFGSAFPVPTRYAFPAKRMGLCHDVECVNNEVNAESKQALLLYSDVDLELILFHWFELFKSSGDAYLYVPLGEIIDEDGNLTQAGKLYDVLKKDPGFLVPNDRQQNNDADVGLAAMWLIIVLMIWAIHYSFDPTYRKSIQRFFQSNRIFIEDLVNKRSRMFFSNYISLAYICVLFGIAILAVSEYMIDETGIQLIRHFIPFITDDNYLIFGFWMGFLLAFIFFLVLIPWGAYVNRSKCHITNFATITLWPNFTLFGWMILFIVYLSNNPNDMLVAAFMGLFFLYPLLSYIYAGIRLVVYSNMPFIVFTLTFFSVPFGLAAVLWWLIRYWSPVLELSELLLRLP
jgi:hypothetical protein